MITLKHLCREFKIDPPQLRRFLRKTFKARKGRWQWEESDKELKKIRETIKASSLLSPPVRDDRPGSPSTA